MPPSDHYVVTDGRERVRFFSGDRAMRDRYQQRFAERTDALKTICSHESMRFLSVATTDTKLDNYAWV